jgi:hypothetical protein
MSFRDLHFSVRGLFLFTALVSVLLLMAVRAPSLLLFIIFLIGTLITFLDDGPFGLLKPIMSGDNPRGVGSGWFVLGAFLVGVSMLAGWSMTHGRVSGSAMLWSFAAVYLIVAGLCYRLTR